MQNSKEFFSTWSKRSAFICGTAIFAAFFPCGAYAASGKTAENVIKSDLVASPGAAVNVRWPKHVFMGKDYWMMLNKELSSQKGVAHEKFIRESGYTHIQSPWLPTMPQRCMAIREIEIFQGGKNIAGKVKLKISSSEREVRFLDVEKFTDGNLNTSGWIMGSLKEFRSSHSAVPFEIDIILPSGKAIEKIVIHTGKTTLPLKHLAASVNGRELDALHAKRPDSYSLTFAQAPRTKNIHLNGMVQQVIYRVGDLSAATKQLVKGKPFTHHHFKFRERHADINPDNVDRRSIQRFRRKYPNFIPETIAEVSANFYQIRNNPKLFRDRLEKQGAVVSTYDRNRYEAEATLRKNWQRYIDLFGEMNMLEGGLPSVQYYYEWGVKLCFAEAMNESAHFSNRNLMMFTRSGARQYSRPWGFYQTSYGNGTYADSRYPEKVALERAKKRPWHPGEDFGISPSYNQRILFLAYYLGANFQEFETDKYGFTKENKDLTWSLTRSGKLVRDFYNWISRPEAKRGEFYAPVLLLNDYYHGNWEWKRRAQWNVWYLYPYEESDYMLKSVIDIVDPPTGSFARMKEFSNGMRNSKYADIYDSFFANAPTGVITQAELGKYPVVFLLGAIRNTPGLSQNLQDYVKKGGTLVINAAQMNLLPEKFAGVKLSRTRISSGRMQIHKITPAGADVLLKTAAGVPLITRYRQGKGHVVLTTPHYMLDIKNKKQPLKLLEILLEKLQSEVLPVRVDGDIQYCFNKMEGKKWKLILFNNKGTFKPPMRTCEEFFPEYAQKVTLSLPAGATAREIHLKVPVKTDGNKAELVVPPGQVAVVELDNVDFSGKVIDDSPLTRKGSLAVKEKTFRHKKLFFYSGTGEGGVSKDVKKEGNALRFNGKTSITTYIVPAEHPISSGGYSCFVKPETADGHQVVITNGHTRVEILRGYWNIFAYDNHTQINFRGPRVIPGKWIHVALMWDKHILRFFLDGKEIIPASGPVVFNGSVCGVFRGKTGIYLGSHYWSRMNLFTGLIRNVRFYGQMPSIQEILQTAAEEK